MVSRIIAIALAATTFACSDSTPPASPTPTPPVAAPALRVSGRIVDYTTHAAVPGVQMRWLATGMNGDQSQRTVTVVADAAGNFNAELPVAERFAINFEPNQYNASATLRVPGKQLQTDLLVNPGPCAARYGMVFDALTRQPIAGATVTRAGTAVTDANGNYRIDIGCEPKDSGYWGIGTTTISAQHPSYQGASEIDGRREATSFSGVRRVDFALQPR